MGFKLWRSEELPELRGVLNRSGLRHIHTTDCTANPFNGYTVCGYLSYIVRIQSYSTKVKQAIARRYLRCNLKEITAARMFVPDDIFIQVLQQTFHKE